jgi:hypothetical protein
MRNSAPVFALTLSLAAAWIGGCSLDGQPALPRRSRIESAVSAAPADELRAVVARADILYLPADRLESDEENGAASRLLNLLQQDAPGVRIGWANISTASEPLFDEWNKGAALDSFLDRIRFASSMQRDATRRLLRESRDRSLASAPLSCAQGLSCTADNVVREFRSLQAGKLFVVIDRRDLDPANGVPFFVAERLQVRQVVFDAVTSSAQPHLMAGASEIVNSAPGARHDRF